MKVTSRDLYAILQEALGHRLKSHGFKRLKQGRLGWTQPVDGHHLSFWFQCDKYGWMHELGSSFTLEFQFAKEAQIGTFDFERRARFCKILDSDDLDLVLGINNDVMRSLPLMSPDNPVMLVKEELRKPFLSDYEIRTIPYGSNEDVWMHYFTREHVQCWAEFFLPRILEMQTIFMKQVNGGAAQPNSSCHNSR